MSGKFSEIRGKRACLEALKSDMPISSIVVSSAAPNDRAFADLFSLAKKRGISVEKIPDAKFEKRFGDDIHPHQGVVVLTPQYEYESVESVIKLAQACYSETNRALIVVCDHITDAGNLGAIARSAESVGASGLVIPNRRSAQVTPATYKTSAGAIAHLPIAQTPNLSRVLTDLKDNGFWVIGATEHSKELVWDVDLLGRIALVLGNEHSGISELVQKNCDICCKLPQAGKLSSLNVAQAATVFMYEWLHQNIGASS